MTWSVSNRPEEQEILTHAYSSIAKELNATLAPVGLVWDELRASDEFNFYVMDGLHPSPLGSYLAASTIFSSLFGVTSLGLSGIISGYELSNLGAVLTVTINVGIPNLNSDILLRLKKSILIQNQ